ncbi:MAG: hypothetical protein ACE5FH_11035 [Candidatus Zixiibacteriota bacterium]
METHESDSAAHGQTMPEIDQMKLQMFMQQVKDNQNLSLGVLVGAAAAVVGAAVWALVTAVTGWQIGFMAIGIGFLVGYAVRMSGKGVDSSFGIAGAILSLLGCILGNYLAVCISIAEQESIELLELLGQIDLTLAIDLMIDTFSPMDVLFYGFALYYGYKSSFYRPTEQEMATLAKT